MSSKCSHESPQLPNIHRQILLSPPTGTQLALFSQAFSTHISLGTVVGVVTVFVVVVADVVVGVVVVVDVKVVAIVVVERLCSQFRPNWPNLHRQM